MQNRQRSLMLASLSSLLAAPALADDAWLTPGILAAVPLFGPPRPPAFGFEVGYMRYTSGDSAFKGLVGLGAFAQAELNLDLVPRVGAGFQAGSFVGAELGLAYAGAGDNLDASYGLHGGAFFSFGLAWFGLRILFGAGPARGDVVAGVKFPVQVEGSTSFLGSGRPIRKDGALVLPEVRAGVRAGVAGLAGDEALANAWLADARLEQASVAAFVRLAQELAVLGAPASLVWRALAAAGEEAIHAQHCFALAARHAGRTYFAAEPMPWVASETDPEALRARLIAEAFGDGLVGEAAAAAQARFALARATDPEAIRALRRIAIEERRHATLAHALLQFCVQSGGDVARDALADAARAPMADPEPSPKNTQYWQHHGRAPMPTSSRFVRRAKAAAGALLTSAGALLTATAA